jgi:hypothetical protein
MKLVSLYTVGKTPWMGDQPVARPLHTHRRAYAQNKHTDIYDSSGIRTQDPSVREDEDSTCLRPRGHRDRFRFLLTFRQCYNAEVITIRDTICDIKIIIIPTITDLHTSTRRA